MVHTMVGAEGGCLWMVLGLLQGIVLGKVMVVEGQETAAVLVDQDHQDVSF